MSHKLKIFVVKTYWKWKAQKCSQLFVTYFLSWVVICSSYGFYLHMRLLKPSNKFMQIVLMRWINQAFMLGPQTWVRLITLKKQPNVQNILQRSERKPSKDYFLKDVWALKMISTQFWIRFWIHSNKFLDKVLVKALFLKSFLVCNFWKIWFWFLLTDPSV